MKNPRVKEEDSSEVHIPRLHQDAFTRISSMTSRLAGGRWAFLSAVVVVVVWAIAGPFFQYSENWQLVINTGTTIVTFLMVFLIQSTQNRDSKAFHLKLDELIVSVNRARNELIDIEDLTDSQLEALSQRYHRVAERNQHKLTECFPPECEPELRSGKGEGNIRIRSN